MLRIKPALVVLDLQIGTWWLATCFARSTRRREPARVPILMLLDRADDEFLAKVGGRRVAW